MKRKKRSGLPIKGVALFCCFCTALFLFPAKSGLAGGLVLLSDSVMSHISGRLAHPFSLDPVVVTIENNRNAVVKADDFYWGDLDGLPAANAPGFIVYGMPDTSYGLSFPNIYKTTKNYESSQSAIPPARVTHFSYGYDPTEVDKNVFFDDDVAVSLFPPAGGKKWFVTHEWGAVALWADSTGATPLNWNGSPLVPANKAFLATATSSMEITSPEIAVTVSLVGEGANAGEPDFAAAHQTENQLGTLSIQNLRIRQEGGITGPNSTVQKVIVVYPNF